MIDDIKKEINTKPDVIMEDTKEKEAMRKILEECKTNKRLAKVILG